MTRVEEQPGWVLHRRPWRESSLLVEYFSRDYGRVGLVARAARGARSTWRGSLEPFTPLLASWTRRGEMGTLTAIDSGGSSCRLEARALWCGLYANELLIRLLARDDPAAGAFDAYGKLLAELPGTDSLGMALRRFELGLLMDMGVVPDLGLETASSRPIEDGKRYHLDPESGLTEVDRAGPGVVDGAVLQALITGDEVDGVQAGQLRGLMRRLIDHQLGGRPLQTRKLFESSRESRSVFQ